MRICYISNSKKIGSFSKKDFNKEKVFILSLLIVNLISSLLYVVLLGKNDMKVNMYFLRYIEELNMTKIDTTSYFTYLFFRYFKSIFLLSILVEIKYKYTICILYTSYLVFKNTIMISAFVDIFGMVGVLKYICLYFPQGIIFLGLILMLFKRAVKDKDINKKIYNYVKIILFSFIFSLVIAILESTINLKIMSMVF